MITEDTKQQSLRTEYQTNLEAQLKKVDTKIHELQLNHDALNFKYQEAQTKLRKLIEAPDETWEDLKPEVDQIFYDLNVLLDDVSAS
jgi:Skp family chaperone for outer membrane proteins